MQKLTLEPYTPTWADKVPAEDEVYIEKSINRDTGRIESKPLLLKKKVLLTGDAVKNEVVLAYVSMHDSTRRMVQHLSEALAGRGVGVGRAAPTRVRVDPADPGPVAGVGVPAPPPPTTICMEPAAPNPAHVATRIQFALPASAHVNLTAYGRHQGHGPRETFVVRSLIDATVGCGSRVWASIVESSTVEDGATVGPFSHLRPGSVVGAGAEVGNYAELKNARLGAGSKQHHMSYLGDAEIGPGANIGAGAITANFDGTRKHPTRIGKGAPNMQGTHDVHALILGRAQTGIQAFF